MHLAHTESCLDISATTFPKWKPSVLNITSSCIKTSPLYFQGSSKHWNISLKPFSESWAPYKVISCLNVSNLAQIPFKFTFSAQNTISAEIPCFLSHKINITSLQVCPQHFLFIFSQ